ncbi:MAG: hypothetical protein QGH33_04425 [Pirellulaceae bacterium]|jgi:hypothetical protein|nr:hypothetical protein [Pirellulaceae bacterium]MDP7304171.1 hypothetical protein [Pirellulaceae bacterium]HJN08662.1 hypothetical protein [Pirellulaceae bacterium]
MTEEAKKRRRFKFGLRMFFIVFTVVCISLGLLGRHLVMLAKERAVIAELWDRGHLVVEWDVNLGWSKLLGVHLMRPIDDDLSLVAELPSVCYVSIDKFWYASAKVTKVTNISEEGLRQLAEKLPSCTIDYETKQGGVWDNESRAIVNNTKAISE